MRQFPRRFLAALLLLFILIPLQAPGETTEAPDVSLPDLRANAPEGTFLSPGEAPVITPEGYRSEHIAITISHMRDDESRSNIVIADIYVSSVRYLRRGFALDKWNGEMRSIKTIAPDAGAILAMTGDYASLFSAGLVAANGEVYRQNDNRVRDNCIILHDGQMLTYPRGEMKIEDALKMGLWHSFLFGPALLEGGEAIASFDSKIRNTNPRSALGYFAPGHYCFVVVDGRSAASRGMTLVQLSAFMRDLGCQTAYNLDGGQSAVMWFNGELVNKPYKGGRRLMDIVYVGME